MRSQGPAERLDHWNSGCDLLDIHTPCLPPETQNPNSRDPLVLSSFCDPRSSHFVGPIYYGDLKNCITA